MSTCICKTNWIYIVLNLVNKELISTFSILNRTHSVFFAVTNKLLEIPLMLENTHLRVSRLNTAVRERTIEVTGLEARITDQVLQLFFKNKGKSGGGPIDYIHRQSGSAIITFVSAKGLCNACSLYWNETRSLQKCFKNVPMQLYSYNVNTSCQKKIYFLIMCIADAAEVVQRGPHEFSKCELVARHVSQEKDQVAEPKYASPLMASVGDLPMLSVRGFPPGTDTTRVTRFFRNARESGGGEITHVNFNEADGHAQIIFQNEKGNWNQSVIAAIAHPGQFV